jgi:hypothetical protein
MIESIQFENVTAMLMDTPLAQQRYTHYTPGDSWVWGDMNAPRRVPAETKAIPLDCTVIIHGHTLTNKSGVSGAIRAPGAGQSLLCTLS